MLVLSRRKNETIVIDGKIAVTVVGITGNVVRLGISAPREIAVHRREVQEKIELTIPPSRKPAVGDYYRK